MKPRHLLMGAALVAAAGLVLLGGSAPEPDVAEPVERAQRPAPVAPVAAPANAAAGADTGKIVRLIPRAELIGATGEGAFGGNGGLFAGQNLNPPPAPPSEPPGPPPPPPVPTAPPVPFTVIGKGLADGAYEVYLANGERTYVVRAKTVIDGMYRVDAIAPPTLTLTYLPLNQVQQLNIGVLD
ncbi:hypothetical protein ACFFTM_04750 [Pseudoduganella plicata]|uniref:Secretion system X translation initiation factor n=1 Tax=Pseudoduganella plicata TaxID=321984 RepID=A0A4P7BIV4_9BURK|nr:hypothetical protein [Pseudoduganella plicata]QBQ38804.1 hypothetical protein E1742_23535 [Pseudoduganella plicata]GGY85218.1 hypothetical protein GCM10007388_18080 [Pseudoduganella plicata]